MDKILGVPVQQSVFVPPGCAVMLTMPKFDTPEAKAEYDALSLQGKFTWLATHGYLVMVRNLKTADRECPSCRDPRAGCDCEYWGLT